MNILKEFIMLNLRSTDVSKCTDDVKKGIAGIDLLEKAEMTKNVEQSYLNYVRNLCSICPEVFEIPPELNGLEKACMMMSFYDYSFDLSMYPLRHEIVGCVPTMSMIGDCPVLIVRCQGCKGEKEHVYCARGHFFGTEMVESLDLNEQCILLIEMVRIANMEKDYDLRRLKLQAYIDRIMFPMNEESALVKKIVDYYRIKELNEFLEPDFALDDFEAHFINIFEFPHVFRCDLEIYLAEMYFNNLSYEKAIVYFEKYDVIIKTIKCMNALNRNEEAVSKAKAELDNLKKNPEKNKIRICLLLIALAEITGNVHYFDEAFGFYRSYEPLKAKGKFFLENKLFVSAIGAFEQTLELVPHNTDVLFLYACSLTSAERYKEAKDVYEKLVADDQKNVSFLRNLGMCRIKLNEISNGLNTLKTAAKYDARMMSSYLLMCIKYKVREEIMYSLERVGWFYDLEDGLDYILEEKILSVQEVAVALSKNISIKEDSKELIDKFKSMSIS
ncbi:hypothetical protein CWI42_030620 [Ordospora colligata]|nr:hypothetical protein CWI41_030290 [Ordospora colligata]TBU16615.1 hypothetical protein CWI40_030690 [Ordospora colligata]TBU19188.1 hypothetical protein CWI42_030620 [Ordospora colligata]